MRIHNVDWLELNSVVAFKHFAETSLRGDVKSARTLAKTKSYT